MNPSKNSPFFNFLSPLATEAIKRFTGNRATVPPTSAARPDSVEGLAQSHNPQESLIRGTIAGLVTGVQAIRKVRTLSSGGPRHPYLTVGGYVVASIAAALLFEKLNRKNQRPAPISSGNSSGPVIDI